MMMIINNKQVVSKQKNLHYMTLKKILTNRILNQSGYPRPNDFFDIDPKRLKKIYDDVIGDKKIIGNKIGGFKRTKNRTQEQEEELINYTSQHDFF